MAGQSLEQQTHIFARTGWQLAFSTKAIVLISASCHICRVLCSCWLETEAAAGSDTQYRFTGLHEVRKSGLQLVRHSNDFDGLL